MVERGWQVGLVALAWGTHGSERTGDDHVAKPRMRSQRARTSRMTHAVWVLVCFLCVPDVPAVPGPRDLHAQQPVSRLKGRVTDESGARMQNAQVRAEAFFGSSAGGFAGQRTFTVDTNAKGEWSIMGIAPGVWLFDASAPGYVPETVALPIRLLTASSPNAGGQVIIWGLVLKPRRHPANDDHAASLRDAAAAARAGRAGDASSMLQRVPEDADAEYLAGAGHVALLAHDLALARALYQRALERDPSSY